MSLVQHGGTGRHVAAKPATADALAGVNSDSVADPNTIGNASAAGTVAARKQPIGGRVGEFANVSKGRGNATFRVAGASANSAKGSNESNDAPVIPTGYSHPPAVGNVTPAHDPALSAQNQPEPTNALMNHHLSMLEDHQATWQRMLDAVMKATEMLAQTIREGAQSVESASGQ